MSRLFLPVLVAATWPVLRRVEVPRPGRTGCSFCGAYRSSRRCRRAARSETSLLALERDEFLGAVTGHAESAAAADAVIASRLRASRPALLVL